MVTGRLLLPVGAAHVPHLGHGTRSLVSWSLKGLAVNLCNDLNNIFIVTWPPCPAM